MITERVLAHRRRIIAELAEMDSSSSDYYVRGFTDGVMQEFYLPKDMTERDWIAYQALLSAAVMSCDAVECNPPQTASLALEAIRPYLPETLTGMEIERTTA